MCFTSYTTFRYTSLVAIYFISLYFRSKDTEQSQISLKDEFGTDSDQIIYNALYRAAACACVY